VAILNPYIIYRRTSTNVNSLQDANIAVKTILLNFWPNITKHVSKNPTITPILIQIIISIIMRMKRTNGIGTLAIKIWVKSKKKWFSNWHKNQSIKRKECRKSRLIPWNRLHIGDKLMQASRNKKYLKNHKIKSNRRTNQTYQIIKCVLYATYSFWKMIQCCNWNVSIFFIQNAWRNGYR
jgi:hypothetical protein